STADIDEFEDDEFDSSPDEPRDRGGNSLLPIILFGLIAILLIIGGLFFAANFFGGGGTDGTETEIAIGTEVTAEPIIPTADSESATGEAFTEIPSETP